MRKVRADLHNHLRTSSEYASADFIRAVDTAERRLGAGGVLGVVNFDDDRYEKFSELRGYERRDLGNSLHVPDKDILIVKGQEVSTLGGHLLVIGLEKGKHLRKNRELKDTIKEARDNGEVLLIADHPYYWHGLGKYLEIYVGFLNIIDGFEVHNGESIWVPLFTPRNANKRAEQFYNNVNKYFPNLYSVVSSDGHSFDEIGSSYTNIWMPLVYENFNCATDVTKSLRDGLKESRNHKLKGRKTNSRVGALNHAVSLAAIVLAEKIGIKRRK